MDISVIIPIYNVEEYLRQCLESVVKLAQKVNVEVIMIDDGSTDNSGEIAKEYAENHKNDEFKLTFKGVILKCVEEVGLSNRIYDKISTYSFGMRQRLNFAKAIFTAASVPV